MSEHAVYVGALFSALGQACLAASIMYRALSNVIRDPHKLRCLVTAYRVTIITVAFLILLRSLPTALIIMFDPPYPLTRSTLTQYYGVMLGLPIAVFFAILVEFTRRPIVSILKNHCVEMNMPAWKEVRREGGIVLVCLLLSLVVVMGRG